MQYYKNLPVLLTGGAGFIGSHIADKLIELGADLTIIDNLSTGNMQNLKNLKQKFKFIEGDIRDLNTCIQVTKNQKIIFHLAAHVSVPESMKNPASCNSINIDGTFNLLESARLNRVEKFIFSSSSAVYGNKETICNEKDSCNPTSIYGLSKLIGEIYCQNYYKFYNIKTICLRYFNVFGERQNPNGQYAAVVAKFTESLKQNKPVIIYGDGTQTRDFIHVNDVVSANLNLAKLDKELNGQPVNIATGKSITLLDLIQKLEQENKIKKNKIIFEPERSGDVINSKADINLYKNLIY